HTEKKSRNPAATSRAAVLSSVVETPPLKVGIVTAAISAISIRTTSISSIVKPSARDSAASRKAERFGIRSCTSRASFASDAATTHRQRPRRRTEERRPSPRPAPRGASSKRAVAGPQLPPGRFHAPPTRRDAGCDVHILSVALGDQLVHSYRREHHR